MFSWFKRKRIPQNERIQNDILKAWQSLLRKQPDIFQFTSDTNQTEWNVAHHFANELCKLYPKFHCDMDLSKSAAGYKRPDIVIHKRNTHDKNFLVIEVKRSKMELPGDESKIKHYWFQPPYSYQYGAVFSYDPLYVAVFTNGAE